MSMPQLIFGQEIEPQVTRERRDEAVNNKNGAGTLILFIDYIKIDFGLEQELAKRKI
jgi:hypothetical protein